MYHGKNNRWDLPFQSPNADTYYCNKIARQYKVMRIFLSPFSGSTAAGVRGGTSPKPTQSLPVADVWKASSFAQLPHLQNGVVSLFILRKALPDAKRCYKGLEIFLLVLKSKIIPYHFLTPNLCLEKAVILRVGTALHDCLWSLPLSHA